MPFWLIVTLGGGAALWLYSRAKGGAANVATAAQAGISLPRYTLAVPTPFYSDDPSTASAKWDAVQRTLQGKSGTGLTDPAGTLTQGTAVSATATQPILSADAKFELVKTADGRGMWVSVAALLQPPGTAVYKISSEGADYFTSDPSLVTGQVDMSLGTSLHPGKLAAGTAVYSTAMSGPQLSTDQSYELVLAPGVGQVWVSIASILAQ